MNCVALTSLEPLTINLTQLSVADSHISRGIFPELRGKLLKYTDAQIDHILSNFEMEPKHVLFQNSPSNSNIQPGLRTTYLEVGFSALATKVTHPSLLKSTSLAHGNESLVIKHL